MREELPDPFRLHRGSAQVTGAGGGIGRAIALALARAGAPVACFDRSAESLVTLVSEIRDRGGSAVARAVDITDQLSVEEATRSAVAELGPLSYAVNAAGINIPSTPTLDVGEQDWERVMAVNLTGVLRAMRSQAGQLLSGGGGSIVNIASMSGTIVNRGMQQAPYVSSKAALVHLTRSVAAEWAGRGVRVNCVSPGYTATPMNADKDAALVEEMSSQVPMNRFARPDEIAGPCVFLLGDAAGYVTGHDLLVDGGHTIW